MGAVQTGLATALATATRRGSGARDRTPYGDPAPSLGAGWTAELIAAGRQLTRAARGEEKRFVDDCADWVGHTWQE